MNFLITGFIHVLPYPQTYCLRFQDLALCKSSTDAELLGEANCCKQQPPNHNGLSRFLTHVPLHGSADDFFLSQFLLSHGFTQLWVCGALSFLPADGEIDRRAYERILWANAQHFCSHSPIQNSITLLYPTTKGSGKGKYVGTQEEEQNVHSCEHQIPHSQPRH